MNKLNQDIVSLRDQIKKQGLFEAGHFYSPIPNSDDIQNALKSSKKFECDITGIELNKDYQHDLISEYINYYKDLAFPEQKSLNNRFYYNNDWFSYSDAIFLYCFLRKNMPNKIIEVGSGYSSAVILDTVEMIYPKFPDITFSDPYPNRLKGLLKKDDIKNITLIERKVQDIPIEKFNSLNRGDLLFIDSSHVVKAGSDVQYLLFNILPLLKPGVFVHFHDIFYPFEYPAGWLMEGRYWNENYFLRAFLSYNDQWRIVFFNTYVELVFADLLREKMPLTQKVSGGSLYIQRK
jgi:hypothetical protein